MKIIPVAQPNIGELEKKYVNDALDSNDISSQGDYIKRFESLFSKKHKAKYGVACSSGTTALTLALASLGIKEGDEVIVPDFTMIATAWAVSYLGAKPVFVDCDERFCIDVSKIEQKITPRTKAIIPVHIYGRVCNMDRILKIARDYNLKVVEDSCEVISTPVRGDIACFSLYANKIITSGEGGICITNNENFAWQMRHLRSMAFSSGHTFYHPKMGYNFRMTNLQGAIALAQTERLEEFLKKRKQIEKWYDQKLNKARGIIKPFKRDVLWMYDLIVHNRDELIEFLSKNGIETRLFFKPMITQPMYREEVKQNMSYSLTISKNGFYLPTYTQITEKDITYITDKIKEFYKNKDSHFKNI
jgi:dTDP-4-amino-4,6-dideoxygalactose transaminase